MSMIGVNPSEKNNVVYKKCESEQQKVIRKSVIYKWM